MNSIVFRRIVYITFIIIFLVVAPLIVLYTMGYRYNFTKGRVQKTGILKITSVPRGADIYLNGVKYALSQTPAKIKYLLPGDYEIKLSKSGYHDWGKKLAVYDNGTTFAEKILLWKQSSLEALTAISTPSWLVSPDKNIVALNDDQGNVSLLDINSGLFGEISGGNIGLIDNLTEKNLRLSAFSPSGRYLLAQTEADQYYLIDTISKNDKKIEDRNFLSVKWDTDNDNLYGLNKTGVWQINLNSLKANIISKTLADDFYISQKTLYLLSQGAISRQDLGGQDGSEEITKLNCDNNCRIKMITGSKIFVANMANQDLFIIDLNRQIKTISAKAKGIDWLNDNSLIFYNDFELYIYDFAKDSPELITRLGTRINFAVWHPQGKHIFFSTDNKIKIIELDNRELRNTIDLAEAPANFMAIDRAGNNLYYAVDKSGIFKLNIQ